MRFATILRTALRIDQVVQPKAVDHGVEGAGQAGHIHVAVPALIGDLLDDRPRLLEIGVGQVQADLLAIRPPLRLAPEAVPDNAVRTVGDHGIEIGFDHGLELFDRRRRPVHLVAPAAFIFQRQGAERLRQQLLLVAEILAQFRRRCLGRLGDAGHGQAIEAMLGDRADRRQDQFLAPFEFWVFPRHRLSIEFCSTIFSILLIYNV